ncbi:EF-hand domain-containing protein [Akkermansiaceae bacterium]|nr:EF-hand domain-containing protein [Akkermansiaceae bacterium]MDB4498578.1 EF-hand domain-containing protein [bacterium]
MRIFTLLFITIVAVAFAKEKVFGNGSLPAFLKHFDTNSDDLIDEEERQAIRDLRAKLREKKRTSIDLNQDGKISENEVSMARAALREQMEQRRLQKFSFIAGEDDLISREEYLTIPGVRNLPDFIFEAVWSRLDTDGSGHVSPEEFLSRLLKH